MTIPQVQLSNTFNEFRQTVNIISNTLNSFTSGTSGSPGAFSANSLSSNTLNVFGLTSGRIPFVAANGAIVDSTTLTYTSGNSTLTTSGQLNSGTLVVNSLTSGRVPFVGSSKNIVDDPGLLFNVIDDSLTVVGNTYIGSSVNIIASNGAIMSTSNVITGNLISRHIESIGSSFATPLTTWYSTRQEDREQHLVIGIGDRNGAYDMAIVNTNTGSAAYSEFIAYAPSGNTLDGSISMGVNSPNYTQSLFSITGPDDGYLLYDPKNGSTGNGNLIIATGAGGTRNQIIIGAGGFTDPANNRQVVITPGESVFVNINTQSSNTTTGALVVRGGIGLNGNLNIGGNVAITGTMTLGGLGNTVSTSTLTVDNPMIFLGSNNAADTLDLGFVGQYTASGTKYSGLVRDASDSGVYKLFSEMATRPANTVAFDGGTVYSTLQLGTLKVLDATASTSRTTGSLIVSGGAGISGNVYASNFAGPTGATISSFTTDQTFAGAANTAVPTAWAVKTYVDNNSGTTSWSIRTTANNNYVAIAGDSLMCDTTNGSFTIVLPASPSNNSRIAIADVAGTFNIRPLIINNNGNKLMGANNILYLDMLNAAISLVYVNSTYGWRII
jgi:hypothetical protein